MLPIEIRAKLFSISFRPRGKGIAEVPSIAFTDIAMVPKIGLRKAFWLNRNFVQYRKNLNIDSWACLTKIYPRAYYIFYYFLLFWWASYCRCLQPLLKNPRPSLVAELFVRYMIEFDRLIDTPNGESVLENKRSLKHNNAIIEVQTELIRHICSLDISSESKRNLCRLVWIYRQQCVQALRSMYRDKKPDFNQVYTFKRFTTGELFRTWAQMLGILYQHEASGLYARDVPNVLYHLAAAIQVMDDMMDFPIDFFSNVPNIFHQLLKAYPVEMDLATEHIQTISWSHLDLTWAENYLPIAYGAALELIDIHLAQAIKMSIDSAAAADLCEVIGNLLDHPVGV